VIAGFGEGVAQTGRARRRGRRLREVAIMKRVASTSTAVQIRASKRVQVARRRRARRDLPELDLRTPSGRRTLPY
jgi:hypothetical protein